jgi:hypothetical protein
MTPLPPRRSRTATALVKLSRLRYLSIQITPFLVGVLASPHSAHLYLPLGALAVLTWKVMVSIANIIADRTEDAIDHPSRTVLVQDVGVPMLKRVLWLACLAYGVLLVLMVFAAGTPADTVALWAFFAVAALAYSFLGVKKRTVGSPALFGAESAAFLWVGWHGSGGLLHWTGSIHFGAIPDSVDQFITGDARLIIPTVLLLWAFGTTLCWSKDVPNLEGDTVVGYRSMYWHIVRGAHPYIRTLAVMSVPYVAILLLDLCGYSPPNVLVVTIYPLVIGFAAVVTRAKSIKERELVRECGYVYWQLFMSAVLISLFPQPETLAIVAASLLWWFVASRRLHPDPEPTVREATALLYDILVPSAAEPGAAVSTPRR